MKTLLHKTSDRIIVSIAAVFILTAPLFYLITRYFYAEDMIDIIESIERGEGLPPSFDLEKDIIAGVMIQYLLIFVVIALSLLIAIRFSMRNMWHPFENTLKSMEKFKVSDRTMPVLENGDIKEFCRLNHTLTRLMKRNSETYRQQKEFTENASHELQTPLAVMRSRLDLLLQRNLDKETLDAINELYNANRRMERLNRDLLLLANIDNDQFAVNTKVDIVSIIRDIADSMTSLGYNVNVTLPETECEIAVNRTLFESLVNNLVVNALRNSGQVDISLAEGKLMVSNPSDNGKPLDNSRLFQRFASTSGTKGNGLGLAIAKAVCDVHRWDIKYDFVSGKHLFMVVLNSMIQK